MIFARNAFSDRQIFFEQRSQLFDHGAGSVPAGFENVLTRLYVQTLDESKFLRHFSNYEAETRIRNDSGIVGGLDAYGFDYVFRATRAHE